MNALIKTEEGEKRAYKIDFSDLQVTHQLGEGSFGIVYRGEYRGADVAVKKLKYQKVALPLPLFVCCYYLCLFCFFLPACFWVILLSLFPFFFSYYTQDEQATNGRVLTRVSRDGGSQTSQYPTLLSLLSFPFLLFPSSSSSSSPSSVTVMRYRFVHGSVHGASQSLRGDRADGPRELVRHHP